MEYNDAPRIVWWTVAHAALFVWRDNPKRHDIGGIISSIERYGFQELPKFDAQLPNVGGTLGAFKAGNGRVEALAAMERDDRYGWPRGIARDETGAWCLPVLLGTDAPSEALAAAYGIDANSLTLSGGDVADFSSLYDGRYVSLIVELAQMDSLPLTVTGDDVDVLARMSPVLPAQLPSIVCPKCGHEWSNE